jgi:hypothetical protein
VSQIEKIEVRADWQVLIPFDRREAISLKEAAKLANKSERTLRNWCVGDGIGRRIKDGNWQISRVALAMVLEDRDDALAAYLSGVRGSYEPVAEVYRRVGLGELLDLPEFRI